MLTSFLFENTALDERETKLLEEIIDIWERNELGSKFVNHAEQILKDKKPEIEVVGKGRHRLAVALSDNKVVKLTGTIISNHIEYNAFQCIGPQLSPKVYGLFSDEQALVVEKVNNNIVKVREVLLTLFDLDNSLKNEYDKKLTNKDEETLIQKPYNFGRYNHLSIHPKVQKLDNRFLPLKNPSGMKVKKRRLLDKATEKGKKWLGLYEKTIKKCGFNPGDLGVFGFGVRDSTNELLIIDGGKV